MASLVEAEAIPHLNIPSSGATVDVKVIDSTSRIFMPDVQFICLPHIEGHDSFHVPSFAFLISNGNRHVVYDLGVRKDLSKGAPFVPDRINKLSFKVTTEKDVAEILDEHASTTGVSSQDIEAVILSHQHWDHTGNLGLFPASTDVIVGPGFKKQYLPAYPSNPDSSLFEPDFEGKRIVEADIQEGGLRLGRLGAFDYFGDGSLYLLSTPGHTIGHLSALARVTSEPATFVLLVGDACHHAAEIRPNRYRPIPRVIKPSPFQRFGVRGCPGELLQNVQPDRSANAPFYKPKEGFNHDHREAEATMDKLQDFDASENVLTIIAHDEIMLEQLPLFPKSVNDWYARDLDSQTTWMFARDFKVEG